MSARTLEDRVESLEKSVEPLRELPARVGALESQIVQLRTGMRQEFSAIRAEMITTESLAAEFDRRDLPTKQDVAAEFDRRDLATRQDLAAEFDRRDVVTKQDLAAEFDHRDVVTKQDLKQELERFATKQELERFATRDDLARTNRRIRYGFRDLKTRMLILHEDLVERLKRLGDAGAVPKRGGARKRR